MKPKVLLIGKNGQLGYELFALLQPDFNLIALDRQQLDLLRPSAIRSAIKENSPQLIINAAAYTAVDNAESDEVVARTINSDAPGLMAQTAKQIGASLVHYSTDYVFDGSKTSPYAESDPPNPLSAYGRTKLAGEEAIRASGASHLIFRTAWVYGVRGRNFLLTMLRLATQREELRVVRDQIGAPTWSREIAAVTSRVIERIVKNQGSLDLGGLSGTYNFTAAGKTNWAEFASAILDQAANQPALAAKAWFTAATNGLPLIAKRVIPITTLEYPTPARRPAYSVLSHTKLSDTFGVQLPDWRSQLQKVFES